MYGAFITPGLAGHRLVIGAIGPSNPFYYAYIIFGIVAFALVIGLKIWRGDRVSWDILGKSTRQHMRDLKEKEPLSPYGAAMPDWTKPIISGSICPRCGVTAGAGAITCPSCGSSLPVVNDTANQAQPPVGAAQNQAGSDTKCPFCGLMLAAGVSICPQCNWRLRRATDAPAEASPRIGIVRNDLMVGGALAFKKDEWVKIEGESPDPDRPEYKYVVLSKALDKRFRLSDADLSV
jgi:ribosomal protein L40E